MNNVVRVEDSKYLTGQGGSGGSGGHTIQNDSGTALQQESALQFVGVYSEDDPTNHKTKVNIIREMTKAQMDALSTDAKKGVIHTTDEADNPANPISADDVTFDNTGTSLSSTNVEGAIKETLNAGKLTLLGEISTADTLNIDNSKYSEILVVPLINGSVPYNSYDMLLPVGGHYMMIFQDNSYSWRGQVIYTTATKLLSYSQNSINGWNAVNLRVYAK